MRGARFGHAVSGKKVVPLAPSNSDSMSKPREAILCLALCQTTGTKEPNNAISLQKRALARVLRRWRPQAPPRQYVSVRYDNTRRAAPPLNACASRQSWLGHWASACSSAAISLALNRAENFQGVNFPRVRGLPRNSTP